MRWKTLVIVGMLTFLYGGPTEVTDNAIKKETGGTEKRIVVDLTSQTLKAIEDGKVVVRTKISSGKPGRETPTGDYTVLEKQVEHVSNLWPKPNGGAKMPYMLRISWNGIAIHLGYVPSYPASHGCIRVPYGSAQKLYRWAEVGTPVLVTGSTPGSEDKFYSESAYPEQGGEKESVVVVDSGDRMAGGGDTSLDEGPVVAY